MSSSRVGAICPCATPTFTYAGTTYTGLAAYQAASGQDTHSLTSNPLLDNPTYNSVGSSLTADTLESGSPAFGAGVNVCQVNAPFYANISTTAPIQEIAGETPSTTLIDAACLSLRPGPAPGTTATRLPWVVKSFGRERRERVG